MEFDNIRQVKKFIEENNIPYSKGLIIVKNCKIKYDFEDQKGDLDSIEEYVTLHIHSSNMDFGIIDIISNKLPPKMVHTNFKPHFVSFLFDPTSRSLVIIGKSKGINIINGEYKVRLSLD